MTLFLVFLGFFLVNTIMAAISVSKRNYGWATFWILHAGYLGFRAALTPINLP